MTDPRPSQLDQSPQKKSPWRNLSYVWLVPVLALLVLLVAVARQEVPVEAVLA